MVRFTGPVRPKAYSLGRHRWLWDDRHYLSGEQSSRHLPERMRQPLESAGVLGELSGRGRSLVRDGGGSAWQRNCLPRLVIALAGKRPKANALHRANGGKASFA